MDLCVVGEKLRKLGEPVLFYGKNKRGAPLGDRKYPPGSAGYP